MDGASDHWDRTASTPTNDASTSTTNCRSIYTNGNVGEPNTE